ncbi:hypothetical protein evm_004167 [Chilo suppressalis]|nr:hypothetical protein evm_004167 [Chilo suppressalis]
MLAGGKNKSSQPLTWTPEQLSAFETCKASLSRSALLAHPLYNAPLALVTDASNVALGAVVQQLVEDIKHISGKENITADALSRVEVISIPPDFETIAQKQHNDPEIRELLENNSSSLKLQKVPVPGTDITLYCDVSQSRPRPYIPKELRRSIFDNAHNMSHPGVQPTTKLITDRFVWSSVKKDCRDWVRSCISCQRSKIFAEFDYVIPQLTTQRRTEWWSVSTGR